MTNREAAVTEKSGASQQNTSYENKSREGMAHFHLPGLFEFYEFYRAFLPLYREHREYFYDGCDIASIYGAPADCIWGGGRTGSGETGARQVRELMREYGISARLTLSNSLLRPEHLQDRKCNALCEMFAEEYYGVRNGVIICSDLLLDYLKENYPEFYFVSSTTKVITDFDAFVREAEREDMSYIVPDFRLNTAFDRMSILPTALKTKIELLCNECCSPGCKDRRLCYEAVSRKNLGENAPEFICLAPGGSEGYRFSKAMESPCFVSEQDIREKWLPAGITNFKIEGRGLGSAVLLEFILYYMTKPEYRLRVREKLYLDSMLDLF